MEKSVDGAEKICRAFGCGIPDIRSYSPLTLAYIGDAVYDQIIRTVLVARGNQPVNKLHHQAVRYVNAETQAAMIEALSELLNEEEQTIYKRGRNAKSNTCAKNASLTDYRKATGFEAVVGYLYLTGRFDRLLELIGAGLERIRLPIS